MIVWAPLPRKSCRQLLYVVVIKDSIIKRWNPPHFHLSLFGPPVKRVFVDPQYVASLFGRYFFHIEHI